MDSFLYKYGTITNKKAVFVYPTDKHCCRLDRDRLPDVGFRSSIQPKIFKRCDARRGEVETQHGLYLLLGYRSEILLSLSTINNKINFCLKHRQRVLLHSRTVAAPRARNRSVHIADNGMLRPEPFLPKSRLRSHRIAPVLYRCRLA